MSMSIKKLFSTKRAVAIGAAAVLTLGIAGGAFAYFTNSGSGTGSASVGTSSDITLAGTITGTLYPAGAPADVSVVVTNSGSGAQYVGSVTLASISLDTTSSTYIDASGAQQTTWASCDMSVSGGKPAFTMADITVDATLAGGGGNTTVTGSLQMNDTGVSQDSCQGAPLTLNFKSN